MLESQIILGIDPALGTTGYGVIRCRDSQLKLVDAGVIRCPRHHRLEQRLSELYAGISELLVETKPQHFAIEQLYTHYDRPTTAILMGHARGVILLAAAQAQLDVASYAATHVKKTLTGNGRASKSQMQFAVRHQLGLTTLPEPADVADALAIALTHHHMLRMPTAMRTQLVHSSAARSILNSKHKGEGR